MVGKDYQTTAGRMAGTGKRTKAQTGAERVKKAHDKKKASGLFLLRVWVHPEDKELVRAYALERLLARGGD